MGLCAPPLLFLRNWIAVDRLIESPLMKSPVELTNLLNLNIPCCIGNPMGLMHRAAVRW